MTYLLDTNTCIYLMKHIPAVVQRFSENRNHDIAISSITLAELEFGVSKSAAKEKNRETLLAFLALVDVLPFEDGAAMQYGEIRAELEGKGQVIGALDMLIAAHGKSKGLTVVTNNTGEFRRVSGLKLEDWSSSVPTQDKGG